jgi:competence protein ComGC
MTTKTQQGFNLIESMIITAIIAIMCTLIYPVLVKPPDKAAITRGFEVFSNDDIRVRKFGDTFQLFEWLQKQTSMIEIESTKVIDCEIYVQYQIKTNAEISEFPKELMK